MDCRHELYLDKPDFWYTLSAPLVARIWDERDTLQRIVRLIRMTTPHTIITMDPRPFDQHGGHQLAARLTIEAFLLAGDPEAFAGQLADEGLRPWRPRRLLTQNFRFADLLGPGPATELRTDPGTGLPVFGVWSGRRSREHGTTWAQVERDAARIYRTQGFAAFPPEVPAEPERLDSDWFTVLADHGKIITAPVREQHGLRPLYANFRDWAQRVGLPWLANDAQPDYPAPPATTIPEVALPPVLNAVEGEGEYPGAALPLTSWQGDRTGHPDVSATAKISRHGEDLYVLVDVADDREGAALEHDDTKRHWRTDAVEIAIDPRGDADDTSVTFKPPPHRSAPRGRPPHRRLTRQRGHAPLCPNDSDRGEVPGVIWRRLRRPRRSCRRCRCCASTYATRRSSGPCFLCRSPDQFQ
jgi:mycothiol S-conjugate amidase